MLKLLYYISNYYTIKYYRGYYSEYYKEKILKSINDSGCVYIKMSQWLATKMETIYNSNCEDPLINNLSHYYENCREHSFDETKNILENYFNEPLSNIFQYIDIKPIASGSIGQVYKGILLNGEEVAVKVRHPWILDEYYEGKNVLQRIVKLNNYWSIFPFDLMEFFDELESQLYLINEVANQKLFEENYKNLDFIKFPQIYYYYNDFIISKFENGISYDEYIKEKSVYQIRKINIMLYTFMVDSLIIKNNVHGDMHIGNWKIIEDGNKLLVLDFGICNKSTDKSFNRELWLYVERREIENIIDLLFKKVKNRKNFNKKEIKENILNSINEDYTNGVSFFAEIFRHFAYNNLLLDSEIFTSLLTSIFMEKIFMRTSFINIEKRDKKIWNEIIREIKISSATICGDNECLKDLKKFLLETMPKTEEIEIDIDSD